MEDVKKIQSMNELLLPTSYFNMSKLIQTFFLEFLTLCIPVEKQDTIIDFVVMFIVLYHTYKRRHRICMQVSKGYQIHEFYEMLIS